MNSSPKKGRLKRENQKKKPVKKVQMNEEIKKQKQEMKKQNEKIESLKNEIKKIKAELENTYHFEIIRQKEDEKLNLKRIYLELKSEKETMEGIVKDQEKHIEAQKENELEAERKKALVIKLKDFKSKNKALNDQVHQFQKEVNNIDGKLIKDRLKIREGKKMLNKKDNDRSNKQGMTTLATEIEDLSNEIEASKSEKQKITDAYKEEFSALERAKKVKQKEKEQLEKTFKEKDKLVRLNALKIASIKRSIRYNILKPVQTGQTESSPQKENITENRPEETKETHSKPKKPFAMKN